MLVKSYRKESSKFENYTLLQSLSFGTVSGCKKEAKNHQGGNLALEPMIFVTVRVCSCSMLTFFFPQQKVVLNPKAIKGKKGSIGAPMPGKVVAVRVKENEQVVKGAPLVVLSAMKMETNVTSPVSGIVTAISVSPGLRVEGNDLLVTVEPKE